MRCGETDVFDFTCGLCALSRRVASALFLGMDGAI